MIFVRLYMVKDKIHMSARAFINNVLLRAACATVLAFILPAIVCLVQPDSFWRLLEVCVVSVIGSLLAIYYGGMNAFERNYVTNVVRCRWKKK